MLYYIRIDVSKSRDINEASASKRYKFVTIGIF